MALVPSGKRRVMVAQTYHNDIVDKDVEMSISDGATESQPDTEGSISDEPITEAAGEIAAQSPEPQTDPTVDAATDPAAQEQGGPADPSLVKYVFDFLTTLGYPPRRLIEFKEQFVHEEGGKGKPTTYTITLPDQIYGQESQIPRDKLKKFVTEIEQRFGYSYQTYKRTGMQIVFTFSSVDQAAQEAAEMQGGDVLDQVYGTPKGKKNGGQQAKAAESIHSMIKASKEDLAQVLLAKLGSE